MITLNLTEEEAENLAVYLSMHSTDSAYDTFGTYEKLLDELNGNELTVETIEAYADRYHRSVRAREVTVVDEAGLIAIKERV